MALTDRLIKALEPRDESYIIADGNGLCLQVTPTSSKLWRYRYRFLRKARVLTLGEYSTVGLADARAKLEEARL